MIPRPHLISRLATVRTRVLRLALRPFRWFSPATQLLLGVPLLASLTTLLLTHWPLNSRTIGILAAVLVSYFVVWRFVDYRANHVELFISKRRAFVLVGSAVLFETALIRCGLIVAGGLAAQSTRAPLNDAVTWAFAIPFAAASLLVTMLLDRQLGLLTGIIASLFVILIAPHQVSAATYSLVSCAVAAYGVTQYRERQSVTLAGLMVAAVNCIAALALAAFIGSLTIVGALVTAGAAISGGLLTIIFASGGVPINESLFGILTDMRLLELSNADLPLLSELALRASGTNQHSHAVSQLAEDACRAIGANTLLARVGSLYHDVGKIAAPEHFVENQSGANPHDRLRPQTSAKIITSHVSYGLRLAKEIGLPQQVADFIPQHHGTRTLHFFLQKARQQASKEEVINEADFRYPGPKPQFKEAAILMLADSCEAAARSLAQPDPQSIRAIVARIFDAIITDGQLDDSNLTLRELTSIREALINSLMAIYHPRIDYPGFNVPTAPEGERDTPTVTYEKVADIPINPSGEVEDEAITRRPAESEPASTASGRG